MDLGFFYLLFLLLLWFIALPLLNSETFLKLDIASKSILVFALQNCFIINNLIIKYYKDLDEKIGISHCIFQVKGSSKGK